MRPTFKKPRKKECSECGQEKDRADHAYCRACRAKYMKRWRAEHVYVKRAPAAQGVDERKRA